MVSKPQGRKAEGTARRAAKRETKSARELNEALNENFSWRYHFSKRRNASDSDKPIYMKEWESPRSRRNCQGSRGIDLALGIGLGVLALVVALIVGLAYLNVWADAHPADRRPGSPESEAMLEERRSGSNSSASSSYVKPSDPSVDADGDGNTPDIFDEVEAEEEAQAAAEAAEAAARKEEAAKEDVSDKLPYKGMDESLIDKTWLGPHEESETLELHNGWAQGEAQKYSWFSKNGKGDEIFTAYVQDGVVVRVVKGLSATDYWPDLFGLPDLYASGTCDEASQWPDRPDPADYDNAEDYWDSLDAYRQHTGDMSGTYEDPYDEWDMDHW